MTQRQFRRRIFLGSLAAMVILTGCGGGGPTGIPYSDSDFFMAGVYNATSPSSDLGMRLVLGSRHSAAGRYEHPSGDTIRFSGTWAGRRTKLFVTLEPREGLPPQIEFDVSREKLLTEVQPSRFSMRPENAPPLFLERDVMRLRGVAMVAGRQVELDLVRIIVIGIGSGGGPGRS